jgi:acetyltransferase
MAERSNRRARRKMDRRPRRKAAAAARRGKPRRTDSLDGIFRPRSVAVVGASRRPSSLGREILRNLIDLDYAGKVFPVNPHASSVASMKCYASVSAIPDEIDLAMIVVPREQVPAVVEECGRKGVKGIVTITAGFREVGGEGMRLEERISRTLRRHGMRMIGPNCMGVINTDPDVRLNATFAAARPERGETAFVSQSGALGEAILANARSLGLGIAMFVSLGNRTDVSANDLLEYWEHDPAVRLILMYLESFGNTAKFIRILASQPVRRSDDRARQSGSARRRTRARSSGGTRRASPARAGGVPRVDVDELPLATAFSLQPIPKGNRVGIVTNAGGPGILATDACVAEGLVLPELSRRTRERMRRILPPEATFGNPVDLIASATPDRFEAAIRAVLADPAVDALIAIFVSPVIVDPREMARAIVRGSRRTKKPVLACFMGKEGAESAEGEAELRGAGVPVYRFPEAPALALGAMNRARILRDRPLGRMACGSTRPGACGALRRAGRLAGGGGRELLPSRQAAVRSPEAAIRAANEIAIPSFSRRAAHPPQDGRGRCRCRPRNADEVVAAFTQITRRLGRRDRDLAVKVQSMVRGGIEVIVGASRDPEYGPLLMFGLGGIHVEVLRDVAVRIAPVTDVEAREMLRSIRGFPLLEGARGQSPGDLAFVEGVLLRMSALVAAHPEIAEMEINPLIVGRKGGGAAARVARRRCRVRRPVLRSTTQQQARRTPQSRRPCGRLKPAPPRQELTCFTRGGIELRIQETPVGAHDDHQREGNQGGEQKTADEPADAGMLEPRDHARHQADHRQTALQDARASSTGAEVLDGDSGSALEPGRMLDHGDVCRGAREQPPCDSGKESGDRHALTPWKRCPVPARRPRKERSRTLRAQPDPSRTVERYHCAASRNLAWRRDLVIGRAMSGFSM